jgi:hypothetical protein
VIEMVGLLHWLEETGTSSWAVLTPLWSDFVKLVAVPEPVTLLSLCGILGLRLGSRWTALQPMRTATRHWRWDRAPLLLGPMAACRRLWSDGRAVRRLKQALRTNAISQEPVAAALVAADLWSQNRRKQAPAPPYESPPMDALLWICRQALEPASTNLLTRYFLRDEWEEHSRWLENFVRYLEQFEGLLQVRPKPCPNQGDILFSEAVTAMSGAVVLTDATAGSSGTLEDVAVWHTGEWHGRAYEETNSRKGPAYRKQRRWLPPFYRRRLFTSTDVVDSLGSYNGRVPTLRSAEIRQRPAADGATLVLAIGEADYRSTEPLSDMKSAPGPIERHCKKLYPTSSDPEAPRIERLGLGAWLDNSPGCDGKSGRGILLNGKICLISRPLPSENYLVLQNRSHAPSNGADMLGPTSGGIVELAVSHDRRDADTYGTVDVVAGIRREMREELGLAPEQYDLGVHAVFLSNSRPYRDPKAMHSMKRSAGGVKGNGELVATLLAIGTTALGPAAFAEQRIHGSASKGLYESRGCVFIPMGNNATEFARNLLQGQFEPATNAFITSTDAGQRLSSGREIRLYLDQAALVAALYAGARVFDPGSVVESFTREMGDLPWWAEGWPGAETGYSSRIIRDPDALAGGEGRVAAVTKILFKEMGAQGWEGLLAYLRQDAEHWGYRR